MQKIPRLFFLFMVLVSCKTNQLFLNVTEPAPVTVPKDVKIVGVINRSIPTEETKVLDVIERVFTLESVDLDKDGAFEAIKGLSGELLNNQRFDDVRSLPDIEFRTSSVELFPEPLSWEIVEKICREKGIDALFSLEKFDTDTHVDYSANKVQIETPLGAVPGLEHVASMQVLVKTGWRIYYPSGRVLLDQFMTNEAVTSSGRGINPLVAAQALTGRKEAVREVSRNNGQSYALRLLPYTIRVTRDYFVKGSGTFKIAKRKAQLGLWDEAGGLWMKETGNSKAKVAGRATYNMAIISEINGDPGEALKWAQKAWSDYGIRLALDYSRILENRLYKNAVLRDQGN